MVSHALRKQGTPAGARSYTRRPGVPNRCSGVLKSEERAWRRVVRDWRGQRRSNGGFWGKFGAKVSESGPDRREKDGLQIHEADALGLGSAVGDEPELVRFPHREGACRSAVVRGFQLLQACVRTAADAPVSRTDRSRPLVSRFRNHPDHGAGGQDEQEHGTGQSLHRSQTTPEPTGKQWRCGARPCVVGFKTCFSRCVRTSSTGRFSRGGPSERSRAGWRAGPSSRCRRDRFVRPSRQWPPHPRPRGRGRSPIARRAPRLRRVWRASPRH